MPRCCRLGTQIRPSDGGEVSCTSVPQRTGSRRSVPAGRGGIKTLHRLLRQPSRERPRPMATPWRDPRSCPSRCRAGTSRACRTGSRPRKLQIASWHRRPRCWPSTATSRQLRMMCQSAKDGRLRWKSARARPAASDRHPKPYVREIAARQDRGASHDARPGRLLLIGQLVPKGTPPATSGASSAVRSGCSDT